MSDAVRIDREAFRRGVEDIMTLAPLRDAVANALTMKKSGLSRPSSKDARDVIKKEMKNGGNFTSRKRG
jgi:hypothetical protein